MTRTNQLFSLILVLCLAVATSRKDRDAPHGHTGKLSPYRPGPFDIRLSQADEQKLKEGGAVMKQNMDGKEAGGAICVQDVDAPVGAVWYQILDLNQYHQKVSKVNECTNYLKRKQGDGSTRIKTKQVLGVLPGYAYESYYDHVFYPNKSSLTWSLDYEKTSDFDDVAGHWHVTEHPQHANKSRVFYACDIQMKGSVPKPILNYISKAALKQATAWVKKESEKFPEKTIASEYGSLPTTKRKAMPSTVAEEARPTKKRRIWGRR